MKSTALVDAVIRVPDIGTFHYVGKAYEQDLERIRSALASATLDEDRRRRPYDVENGVRMYGGDLDGRRDCTFATLDSYTFAATMVRVSGCASERCKRYLGRHNADESVSVCAALDEYAGVYVEEWSAEAVGSGIPDSERQFLDNNDS